MIPLAALRPLAVGIEGLTIVAVSFLAAVAADWLLAAEISAFWTTAPSGSAAGLIYAVLGWSDEALSSRSLTSRRPRFVDSLRQWTLTCVILLATAVLFDKAAELVRADAVVVFAVCPLVLNVSRTMVARLARRSLAAGWLRAQTVIIVGPALEAFAEGVGATLRCDGVHVAAGYALPSSTLKPYQQREALKRTVADVLATIEQTHVDEIIVAGSMSGIRMLDELLVGLRDVPLAVQFLPDSGIRKYVSGPVSTVGARRLFELQRAPLSVSERIVKRGVDMVGAAVALVMLAPFLLTVAVMIKVDSRGPILFKQTRIGFGGRPFKILKFRSMTTLEDGDVVEQATRRDRRITRVGQWLRATSIDELPQLINVLKGEMSLIGPRPHARAHHELYRDAIACYALRHHIKPGITGWAQANGYRGETPTIELMEQRVLHDLWYIRHWSFWLDLKTVLLTLRTLFTSSRAY